MFVVARAQPFRFAGKGGIWPSLVAAQHVVHGFSFPLLVIPPDRRGEGGEAVNPRLRGISLKPTALKFLTVIKPTWRKAAASLVASLILGQGGIFLYLASTGWFADHGYSPYGRLAAYVLSWPVFLIYKVFFGSVQNAVNFDPVVWSKFGWLCLWIYYYILVLVGGYFKSHWRTTPRP